MELHDPNLLGRYSTYKVGQYTQIVDHGKVRQWRVFSLAMMVYLRFVVCKDLRANRRWPKIARMLNLPDKGGPGAGPKPMSDLRT